MRVYEAAGQAIEGATLRVAPGLQAAQETDLLEREQGRLAIEDGALRFDLQPFEIKTFKLNLTAP